MAIIYRLPEGATDAKIVLVPGYKDRAVIKYYDHQSVLRFSPADPRSQIDGNDMLNDYKAIDDHKDQIEYVYRYSYPIDTAQLLVKEVNG